MMSSSVVRVQERGAPGRNASPRFACEEHVHSQAMFALADNPLVAVRLDLIPSGQDGYTCSVLTCNERAVWIVRAADPFLFAPTRSEEAR